MFIYRRFRNYLYTRMVAGTVKLRPILPQANSLCYKVDAPSVNLFLDFTIMSRENVHIVMRHTREIVSTADIRRW